jgi:glucan biosynthesis protein C
MTSASRNHALDNLRGVMMWLGIVLHVAVNHMQAPSQLPWKDSQTSPVADLILMLIHAFRMPAFFILAGFFVARMVEQRGHAAMLKNRLRRIGLPFVVFWPILAVLIGCLAVVFVHVMQRGVFGFDISLLPRRPAGQPPVGRLHLWFLVDLLWLYGLSALLLQLRSRLPAMQGQLVSSWWGALILTLPLALIGALYPHGILNPVVSFMPNLPELAHYGLFYAAGWIMYAHRETVLPRLQQTCGRNGVIGMLTFVASMSLLKTGSAPNMVNAFFYCATAWFWSFALIGGFSKYTTRQTPWMSYLAESSYWVYLVHMVGTIGFGILLYNAPLGFMSKMLLNIAATTAACLLSYQLFVRNSPIGVLLNGRRTGPATAPAEAIHCATTCGEKP